VAVLRPRISEKYTPLLPIRGLLIFYLNITQVFTGASQVPHPSATRVLAVPAAYATLEFANQSVSSLCGSAESGIKRIVVHWGLPPALTRQDLKRKQSCFS